MPFNEAELDLIKTRAPDEGEDDAETTAQAEAMTEWAEYAIDQLPAHCEDLQMAQQVLGEVWKHYAEGKDKTTSIPVLKPITTKVRRLNPELWAGYASATINTHSPVTAKDQNGDVVRLHSPMKES